jgi:outer membrane protein assembly factor BamB
VGYTTFGYVDSSPAVANGVVYIGSGEGVFALNASTGKQLWKYRMSRVSNPSPAVANGVVYVGSDDHNVYALNAKTGAPLWSYATGGAVATATVADGVVYIGSTFTIAPFGRVYAFGLKQGQR